VCFLGGGGALFKIVGKVKKIIKYLKSFFIK